MTKTVSEGPPVLSPLPPPLDSRRIQAPAPSSLRPRILGPQPLLSETQTPAPSPSLPAESTGRTLEQELPGSVFVLCDVTQEDDVKVSA